MSVTTLRLMFKHSSSILSTCVVPFINPAFLRRRALSTTCVPRQSEGHSELFEYTSGRWMFVNPHKLYFM
ncbi:hypothetical protein BDV23DRAFT_165977 [Aspergillus alliaceus]|uniref:Uncharacterized protein n=1 Tax=Petromyces alliaceus TaxID=209559 RepID=A0A5N7BST3_PETAA|nr:hypothetical protein BDV23DRAFT_165977 [Aspergillus alliaceus]